MTEQVVWGELSEALLDQLSALSSEVFLPLLYNRTNTEKVLPEVVARSVTDGLQRFAATGTALKVAGNGHRKGFRHQNLAANQELYA